MFGIGLLGASALAAAVVPLSTSYAVAEAVGVERSVSKSFRQAPLFLGLFTAQIIVGAAVVLVPGNLFTLIINTQVLEGVITPITLVFILILANRRSLLGVGGQRQAGPLGGPDHGADGGGLRLVPGGGHRPRLGRSAPVIAEGHGLQVMSRRFSLPGGQFALKYLAGRVFVFYVPARPGCPCLASG